jgi:hypothetical protein
MTRNFVLIACIALGFTACKSDKSEDSETTGTEAAAEVPNQEAGEWIVLFDGENTDGWRGYNAEDFPGNWTVEDGALKALGTGGNSDIGGDIIFGGQEFENFELELEWKISEGGNSGIFYHVKEGYDAPYFNAPEYQVLDDEGFPDPLEEYQKAGADYAMYVPNEKKSLNPAGEWNTTRIIFTPEKVEYWLNGEAVVSFVPWSEEWNRRVNEGKWKDFPDYGSFKSGYIGLQDHGDVAWFRNIRVKKL